MTVIALVLAAAAGLLHVFIFTLESLRWREPSTWRTFGVASQADADTTAPLAYNQGFYNLFLAIITLVGLALLGTDHEVGTALALAGTGAMLAAALVLLTRDRSMARAAITQGTFPLLAVVFLLLQL